MSSPQPVVIVGGGFAGVYTARALLRRRIPVRLISETNYFTFTPLLHEVATGILSNEDITFEYASFFRNGLFRFLRGRVERVDFERRVVHVNGEEMAYSDVVIATGARTNTYDIKGTEHAFELKSIHDAMAIKKRVIALGQGQVKCIKAAVVGGGPTGIELVLDLKLFLDELKRNNPEMAFSLRIIQVDDRVLKAFPAFAQQQALRALEKHGVEVQLSTHVTSITPDAVTTDNGNFASNLTILVAGVTPNVACVAESGAIERGHVSVDACFRVKGKDHAFALGDVMAMEGVPVPKLAQTATQEAEVVAENIARTRKGQSLKAYKPNIIGMLLSLGYRNGAGVVAGVPIWGLPAWFLWRTVYLFKTPGLYNKLRVAFSWTVELFQRRNLVEE